MWIAGVVVDDVGEDRRRWCRRRHRYAIALRVANDGHVNDYYYCGDDANDVAFDGDDKCFYDCSNYSMCETLCDRDYKRHCLMAVDAVVPCDVSMLIWCLEVCRIHRIDGKQLMAMEAISVRCRRHYFQLKHHHHYHHYYN